MQAPYISLAGQLVRVKRSGLALVDLSHSYFVIRFHQEEDMMDEGLDRLCFFYTIHLLLLPRPT